MDPLARPWSLSHTEWLRANAIAYGLAVAFFGLLAIGIGVLLFLAFADPAGASAMSVLMPAVIVALMVAVTIVFVAIGAFFNSIAFALPLTALASRAAARAVGPRSAAWSFAAAGGVVGLLGTAWPFTLFTLFSASINDRLEYPWGWVVALPVFVVVVAALYLAAWAITVRPRTRIARVQARTAAGSVAK